MADRRRERGASATLDAVPRTPLVVLAGSPNTGKTTLFNRLTGLRQKVGNYPGITVERSEGRLSLAGAGEVRVLDLPGTYSLAARSEEEQIALHAIVGLPPYEPPDAAVVVVDATQLTRNLYLVLQVIETDVPTIVALNMVDMLEEAGVTIDVGALGAALGVPVVALTAVRGTGVERLREALDRVLQDPASARPGWRWRPAGALAEDVAATARVLPGSWTADSRERREALALWALLSIDEDDELREIPPELRRAIEDRRQQASGCGRDIESEVIGGRYAWIDAKAPTFTRQIETERPSLTSRLDAVFLHPVFGFALFLLAMGVVFQSLFSGADPAIGAIEGLFDLVSRGLRLALPPGLLLDFAVDGLIAGVGSVIVFLPQILLLFFFIGVMEDTGYMSRVAFLMDRVMKALGLHGRAFVPMLSGFACAIPAVLATRTLENRKDRLVTMLALPFTSCSARLPIYMLVVATVFHGSVPVLGVLSVGALVLLGMYSLSLVAALTAAAVLRRTVLKGPAPVMILELPPYRRPLARNVVANVWLQVKAFLVEAGTIILAMTVLLWALLSYPERQETTRRFESLRGEARASLQGEALDDRLTVIGSAEAGQRLRESAGGQLGHFLEPALAPLGFDWRIGVGIVGAFAAREVFVSTLGIVFDIEDADETSESLRETLRGARWPDGRKLMTPLTGVCLMVFFVLACQCMSTLSVVARESGSWHWAAFLFVYMTTLAYVVTLAIQQGGRALGIGG